MELEDLKAAWRDLDRRMQAREATDARLLEAAGRQRARSALRPVLVGQSFQALLWGAVISVAAPLWIQNRAVAHWLVFGLTTHVYAVATIVLSGTQVLLVLAIHFDASVVDVQRRLALLRRQRLRHTLLLALPFPMLWVVFTVVGAKWLLGVDLYAASPGWIHLSIAIGALMSGLILLLPRLLRGSARGARWLRAFAEDVAGCSLRRATREIDEVVRFAQEATSAAGKFDRGTNKQDAG